jgi:hypothetical protein
MAVTNQELAFFKPESVTDDNTNGGKKSTNKIISNTLQNVFPNVFSAERLAGSTKYRKVFCTVQNAANTPLLGAWSCFFNTTPGDSYCYFFEATPTDTQADIVGTELKYGTALVSTAVTAGATEVTVTVENSELATGLNAIYRVGEEVMITDMLEYGGAGNTDLVTITNRAVTGNDVTLTVSGINNIDHDYAVDSKVISYPAKSSVEALVDTWDTSATSATIDQSAVYADFIGAVEHQITLTMTSNTAFTCSSSVVGALEVGATDSEYAPVNGDYSRPFFTIPADTITGASTGEVISFWTHCPDIILWEVRVIPPNCASLSGDNVPLLFAGESS